MRGFFNEHLTYGGENERKLEVRINPAHCGAICRDRLSKKIGKYARFFLFRLTVYLLVFSFVFAPVAGYAQSINFLNLPIPGTMVGPSSVFAPVLLKGLTIHPDDPLKFDFIIDAGHTQFTADEVKKESERLVKYFLASMTVPKDDLWVNLSPYENDRIIPDELGKTELGRDMLAQDYLLKQLTASLMYPEEELGGKFWDRIYQRAEEEYGTSEIPVNTFNKVWILPESATVYEHEQTVYVVDAKLKVMLDSDYEAMKSENGGLKREDRSSNLDLQSSIIKEIIIPEIEREVNEGKNFAPLRQIFHSLILAKWYKKTVKNSLLNQVYADKKLIDGIRLEDGGSKMENGLDQESIPDSQSSIIDQIYARYMEAYKKGVFNYIREDYDRLSDEVIPRKYFSGGLRIGAGDIRRTSRPIGDSENPQYWVRIEVTPQKLDQSSSPVEVQERLSQWEKVPGVKILWGGRDGIGSDDAEILALVDENGQLTGEEASKIDVHQLGLWHMTSHVYIFDEAGRLLLQKRSLKKKSSAGKLQVSVSGHVNAGEEPDAGVFREGEEEIGIPIDPKRLTRMTKVNEIKRSYPTEEGQNNEFTTIYKYTVSDEELRQIEQNYNINENDEFWLIPVDVFERMIEEDPGLFSRSLYQMVYYQKEIYRRVKAADQHASSPVKGEEDPNVVPGREVLSGKEKGEGIKNFIDSLRQFNVRVEKAVELFGSGSIAKETAYLSGIAQELKLAARWVHDVGNLDSKTKDAILDVLGNSMIAMANLIDIGLLEQVSVSGLKETYNGYQNELRNFELIVERGELGNIRAYWAPSHFVNLDQLPEKKPSSSPVEKEKVGGIDFHEIGVERQGAGVDIRLDPVEIQNIINTGVDGFVPVIIDIFPLPSVLPLLGLVPQREEEIELSQMN